MKLTMKLLSEYYNEVGSWDIYTRRVAIAKATLNDANSRIQWADDPWNQKISETKG